MTLKLQSSRTVFNAGFGSSRGEGLTWAQGGHCDFSLRALAARKMLQMLKCLCSCAARKQAIHASRCGNHAFKDQAVLELLVRCDCTST